MKRIYFTFENVDYVADGSLRESSYVKLPDGRCLQVSKWDESNNPENFIILEKSPPKWSGTVMAMKKHKEIDNPFALSWYMKNKGYKPHYKPEKSSKEDKEPEKKKKYKKEDKKEKFESFKEFFRYKENMSNKDFVKMVQSKHAPTLPGVNPEEYPPIPGMEGPFQFKNGRILYYSPRDGKYYDRKMDQFIDNDELKYLM